MASKKKALLMLPEYGYTPANYQALVKSTNLSPKSFYTQFDIAERTFFNHKSGARTMGWQEWQSLVVLVQKYLETQQALPTNNQLT